MFKILTLAPGVDDQLQAIQNTYEIDAVENLGNDSTLNHYLLVQYSTAAPGTTNPPSQSVKAPATTGSQEVEDKKPAPKKVGK